jgi:hypothetical protein
MPPFKLATRSEANLDIVRRAKKELVTFVKNTLRSVITQEQRQYQAIPSLAQFCRVDVGLIRNEEGKLDYFVNEIERGINVGLWSGAWAPEKAGKVAEKMATVLYSWIKEQKRVSNQLLSI